MSQIENIKIYELKLEDNKYYVGKTAKDEPLDRILQHFSENGSEWTKKYKPIDILNIHLNCDSFDEDKYTKIMMSKHGIDNVRGGSYVTIYLSEIAKQFLNNELKGAADQCFNCGSTEHFIINCPENTTWSNKKKFHPIDPKIFNDVELTSVINDCLDGHKRNKIAMLMSMVDKEIARDEKWYIFHENAWIVDKDQDIFYGRIMQFFELFDKIRLYYEQNKLPDSTDIISNINLLEQSFNKPGFKNELISEAGMYYNQIYKFQKHLNTKKNLVAFTTGVYDTAKGKFRDTLLDDYISVTVGYEYNPEVCNKDVYTFLEQVLPNKDVRDYMLKRLSDCLNGDLPNKLFTLLIGDTTSGNSQILNLAKVTMGELGTRMNVKMITRSQNNELEKSRLLYKRYASFSEPEKYEKINIKLLTELTGYDEIVSRALYNDPISFVNEAKFFLACNELPEIKGANTTLLENIRIIEFPSKFVKNPVVENEYSINENLSMIIRDDVTWRQTFMNILIEYYNKDVLEPVEVRVRTNEYKSENNNILEKWVKDNLIINSESTVSLSSVTDAYYYKYLDKKNTIPNKEIGKFKIELQNIIKIIFKKDTPIYKDTTLKGKSFHGWIGMEIKSDICSDNDN